MADAAALCADLPKRRRAEIDGVHRHHRRTLRAAVSLERPDAEVILKRHRYALRQFFRARHHEAQAAEFLRRAAPQIRIQERGRRQEHGHRIFVDKRADHSRIQGIGMKHHAGTHRCGQAQSGREAEGMEKRQNPHDAIVRPQKEDLVELLDVRRNVVLRQHHALGLARRPAGENNRCQVIETGDSFASRKSCKRAHRQQKRR